MAIGVLTFLTLVVRLLVGLLGLSFCGICVEWK